MARPAHDDPPTQRSNPSAHSAPCSQALPPARPQSTRLPPAPQSTRRPPRTHQTPHDTPSEEPPASAANRPHSPRSTDRRKRCPASTRPPPSPKSQDQLHRPMPLLHTQRHRCSRRSDPAAPTTATRPILPTPSMPIAARSETGSSATTSQRRTPRRPRIPTGTHPPSSCDSPHPPSCRCQPPPPQHP